ncbi:ABC transporter permease [Rufibacter latericius]|uniref:FtsX-like permease family protein n=1 Tax=Rufibacter latericius TaxID=2487040 RepID=A0A3M9MQA4_9BACT|nr:ABC transporter permease [Rufibacter latericius]RNI26878.1 FtsX-like permease family protein [Rufibacter latericius]
MFKNYLLVAVRTLQRNLGYTSLNIIGLALGITCSLLLFLVIRHELSYDTFHSKADRTYRINVDKISENGPENTAGTPVPMLATLKATLPELTPATHLYNEEGGTFTVLSTNAKEAPRKFREERNVLFVEPAFFDLFDFDTNGINAKQAIKDVNTVLLTQTIADKFFPSENPVGRILRMNNKVNLKVTGVIPDAPDNTDLPFQMLIDYESSKKINTFTNDSWNSTNSNQQIYFALSPGASLKQAEDRLNEVVAKYRPRSPGEKERYTFQPLSQVHFDERYGNLSNRTISKTTLWALGLIGMFLVLVASINFVNLATAQALRRAKEVGMRKVLGASKSQLMTQFLLETGLITLTALSLSVVFAELLLPSLNKLLELQISFSILKDPQMLLFLLAVLVAVTFFAGFYPALVISGFQPISALKSKASTARAAGLSLRRTLVVLQFTVCQVLIICTIIVHNQMEYFRSASLGFDKEAIVNIQLPSGRGKELMAFRPQMEAHPAIKSTSFAIAPPSANIDMNTSFKYDDLSLQRNFSVNMKIADEHYLKTFNIPLLAGRMYEKSDTMREFLVNETFLRQVGEKDPQNAIGKMVMVNGDQSKGKIVGVVKDYHLSSLRDDIPPVVMSTFSDFYLYLNVKLEQKNAKAALAHLQNIYQTAYPDDVFYYEFFDDSIARFYEEEQRQAHLFKVFSVIAILIGCLGLYGLVSFMVAQRTKEVGVRKVLGASSASIVGLFSIDFVKLVLIAFVIAGPISYYFMDKWLQEFTYRIHIGYWVFLAAGALTLLIALTTVSVQALRAAFSNPVRALKTE